MSLLQLIKKNSLLNSIAKAIRGKYIKFKMISYQVILGINKNKIVFVSFNGGSYSDNPKAISEKLHELHPEFKIVWLFSNPIEKRKITPNYIRCVKVGSNEALKELATAKFWVDNFCKSHYLYKGNKQIYIQTWHGDRGFKKILYDVMTLLPNGKYKEGELIESKVCDLAICGSEYGRMQFRSAFKYKGKILQEGYPRNDILVNNDNGLANKIKKTLNIEATTNVLLYAPTFREEAYIKRSNQNIGNIDLIEVLHILEKKSKKQWVCFVRAHSAVNGLIGIPNNEKFIDVSSYEDMNELLLISDMLITDYSSSAGDFALLQRPIILFQSDRNEYIEKDRNFYFNIDKSPFMIAMNQTNLIEIIEKIDMDISQKNCKNILDFYDTNETGKSSEAVVNYIISRTGDENNVW